MPCKSAIWCFVGLLVITQLAATSQPTTAPSSLTSAQADDADRLAKEFEQRLSKSRYMESGEASDVRIPGWDGFPIKRYHYSVTDKDGIAKSADVVMLNPSAKQIARWIVQALSEVHGQYDPDAGRKIFKHILAQSGGQFPVAGVVYEDILPEDGKYEVYCFRDGVTVEVEGVKHRTTEPLTADEIEASISGKLKRIFTYARIQSTTPQQFIEAGGPADILKYGKPTPRWPEVIRQAYQEAWTSDRNALLVAWVKANPN
jgi:hypothetical protein